MKPIDIDKYRVLNDEFYKECHRVSMILAGIIEWKISGYNIFYADTFVLKGAEVYWSGTEWWPHDEGTTNHKGVFKVSYLSMTDEELQSFVEEYNKNYLKELDENEKLKKEKEKAERLKMYEELKKEFGG